MSWYIGDPCYVVPKERWGEFCGMLSNSDSPIVFDGVPLEIFSNGGDGTWWWGKDSFCVDSGIFTIIPMYKIEEWGSDIYEAYRLGIVKEKEPTLRVEDNIVFINDVPDDSVIHCASCGEYVHEHETIECECQDDIECYQCFECQCEEE